MANEKKIFTYRLTGSGSTATFTVTADMGFQRFSIYNGTAVAGTYIGSAVAEQASAAIDVAQNETAVIDAGNAYVIEYLLISAPNGCTLKLMGS